jgi:hypothetical protein
MWLITLYSLGYAWTNLIHKIKILARIVCDKDIADDSNIGIMEQHEGGSKIDVRT